MVSPQVKRQAVDVLREERGFGVTRACGLLGISSRLVFALSCGGSGALDRAGARASLAVPAAGGIHDDLVTPYLAAACVGLTQRRRVMTRKTRKIHKIDPETGVSSIDGELGRI